MNSVRFFTSTGHTTLKTAQDILGSSDFSSFGISRHEVKEFKEYLEEPMIFSLKRGWIKSMIISKDEPILITRIKKSLLAELQNVNATFSLKHLKKLPIVAVLPIPSKPKKVDAYF